MGIESSMHVKDTFRTAFLALRMNITRTILTVLGIVIGVASVIIMLSVGRSAEGLILNQVADLGSDLVFVEPSSGEESEAGPPSIFVEQTLSLDDLDVVRESDFFLTADATLFTTVPVSHLDASRFLQVVGVTDAYTDIFPADLLAGRFFDEADISSSSRVAVLGKEAADKLFGLQDPIGERITIKNSSFRVVGVFDEQGSRFFQNLDEQIAVPVTALQQYTLGVDYVNFIAARVVGSLSPQEAKTELRFLLRDRQNLDDDEADNFLITTQSDAEETVGVVGTILTVLLASIAAISLVVGGIGIMNIMLVSVTERTKEVGLRKALGATNADILRQFLLEATLLTLGGGLLGILSGVSLSFIGATIASRYVDGWEGIVPISGIILGFAVSLGVGLTFGVYPAKKAASLQPVDALRYE
jgi:putative ABC transport system permease protein